MKLAAPARTLKECRLSSKLSLSAASRLAICLS